MASMALLHFDKLRHLMQIMASVITIKKKQHETLA